MYRLGFLLGLHPGLASADPADVPFFPRMALGFQETALGLFMGTTTMITLTHSLLTHSGLVLQSLSRHAAGRFLRMQLLCVPFGQLRGLCHSDSFVGIQIWFGQHALLAMNIGNTTHKTVTQHLL